MVLILIINYGLFLNNSFPTTNWIWNIVSWSPSDINHMSSTNNSSHLWVQTSHSEYLYDRPDSKIYERGYSGLKRVYGKDIEHYIEIDQNIYTAIIYPENTTISNIYDGALSYYGSKHQLYQVKII